MKASSDMVYEDRVARSGAARVRVNYAPANMVDGTKGQLNPWGGVFLYIEGEVLNVAHWLDDNLASTTDDNEVDRLIDALMAGTTFELNDICYKATRI